MADKRLYGVVPALLTPLNEDGTLDTAHLEMLVERQLLAGVHGIFVAGMTGEGALLDDALLGELISHAARIIGGRVPLCAGVLRPDTDAVIHTAQAVENAGADMLASTVPTLRAVSQEEIIAHFDAICRHTNISWMVYGNSGAFTNIEPQTMAALARLEGIKAIKDTRSDFEGCLKDIIAVRDSGTTHLCGGEYLVGPGLLFGSDGNISGATNLFPELFVQLYNAVKANDVSTVRAVAEKIAYIHTLAANTGAWLAAFKYIGSRMGLMQPFCASGQAVLSEAARRTLDAQFGAMEAF